MLTRPRRNRKSPIIRNLVQENYIQISKLIQPLFLLESTKKESIPSMPHVYRFPLDDLLKEIEACLQLGISSFIIFPVIPENYKDKKGSYSYKQDNFYLKAISKIKNTFKNSVCIITDVALDPYNSDGHDGIVQDEEILNDETITILEKMALMQAQAGADIIAPSDMMDGRILHIRKALDNNHLTNVNIMSYTAKYASAFYAPFRDALHSTPKKGDKKTYQMNYANSKEALLEATLDEKEGADILLIKPALLYLDIIHMLKQTSNLPIATYHVSGEYAMLKSAIAKKWLDNKSSITECFMSMKRAGADIIISYASKEFAQFNQ